MVSSAPAQTDEEVRAHLAAIIDSSDDVIVSKNLDGVITSWNKSAERIFGYTSDEAVGKHIGIIIPEGKIDEEYAILAKIKQGQRIDHFETVRRAKDGRPVNISLTVSPIMDSHNNIIGVSKVARDITEQLATQKTLVEANRKRDEFMANISHELRTPMNAVVGLAGILSMSPSLSDKEKQYVKTLRQSADSLLSLINNLLDFSKIDTESLELEEVEFDLSDVVDKTCAVLSVKAQDRQIPLRVTYDPALKKYYAGDPMRIQQILTNLGDNAIKFSSKTSVEICVSVLSEDENGSRIVFEVIDNGIGIPEDKINAVFEKFVQADASITRKYGGTGLGLSICKALAEKMGGSISVKSRLSLGTTFRVELPLKNGTRASKLSNALSSAPVRKDVLIVEDYEANVVVVCAILDRLGYTFDVAENGLEAVKMFQQSGYGAVLMDIQMHEMDGFESTQKIRAFERERKAAPTPIIAMTAHVHIRDKDKCLEVGMNDFISKPFDIQVLDQKLSAIIPKGKQAL